MSSYLLLFIKLLILFILESYRLFHNTMMSDLSTDQLTVKVMTVAEKRNIFSCKSYRSIQISIM